MAEKYDKLLSTILIGNNIVNIAAASIGTIIFTKMLGAERGATGNSASLSGMYPLIWQVIINTKREISLQKEESQ